MATAPSFASTVRHGVGLPATTETSLTAPAQSQSVLVAGASGTKIEEVVLEAATTSLTPTTVAGLIYLFVYDGATYHLFDTLAVTAVTASATTPPFRLSKTYVNLTIPSGSTLKASQSIAGNASLIKVHALGADF
jgi:hypothetical protein